MPPILGLFAVLFESTLGTAAVAGGAVSIPIIIHLLNRRRYKVVTWAAMRFLMAAQKKNSRRMRIEQLLLLAVRCLMVALVVLAMASVSGWAEKLWHWVNPEGGKGLAGGGARTHRILVLDGSLSMNARAPQDRAGPGREARESAFDRAKALAKQIVQEGSGDAFSVVLMGPSARRIVPEPSEDARKVLAELEGLKPTHGNADLAGTLATVAGLLKASPGKFPAKEVYFLTDLQQSTWISKRPADLAPALLEFQQRKARAVFVDVGQEGLGNLAVSNLELGEPVATTGRETPIVATLLNYGETLNDVSVRLYVGRARGPAAAGERPGAAPAGAGEASLRQVGEAQVRAERGQQTPVAFKYRFPGPGDYVVQVQTTHDALELDDIRSAVVTVKNTVPVLLVNGKPAPEAFDRATEWLRVALNPYDEGEAIPASITARPKVVSTAQFADEGTGDLGAYDAVFLCDVERLSDAEVRRLEAFVRRGGGVVFCLGRNVDLGSYNLNLYRDGNGLLPARLVAVQPSSPGYAFQLGLDPEADRFDPLKPFRDPAARERLLMARFARFVQTEAARPLPWVSDSDRGRTGTRKVLSFVPVALPGTEGKMVKGGPPPGGPAVLEWNPPVTLGVVPGRPGAGPGPGPREAPEGTIGEPRPVAQGPTRLRGRVVLVTTAVNSDWGNWPVSPAFPAFANELLNFATAPRLREQSLTVGDTLELFLSSASTGAEGVVSSPDGRPEAVRAVRQELTRLAGPGPGGRGSQAVPDAGALLRWADTDASGVYKIVVGQSPREHLFAVNVPSAGEAGGGSESDLTRTSGEEMQKTYPEWDVQVVQELRQVQHATSSGEPAASPAETVASPQGQNVAHVLLLMLLGMVLLEVVLAWQFGHYSAAGGQGGGLEETPGATPAALKGPWATAGLLALRGLLFGGLGLIVFVLAHDALTGDFLGFLPEAVRGGLEGLMGVPPPAAGEGSRWRLEYLSYFLDARTDPWLAGLLGVVMVAGVVAVYRMEGGAVGLGARALLVGLRLGLLLLLLLVLLPQLRLHFERQGWPDVAVLIDDSASMGAFDAYRETKVKEEADRLATKAELTDDELEKLRAALASRPDITKAGRLRLAQVLVAGGGPGEDWLTGLLDRRKVRLHVYRCSARAQRLADVTTRAEVDPALKAVAALRAEPEHDSSQLGAAVRQVVNDFRGSSLAAVVMVTDGVTTEGEELGKAARYSAQMGVPLFFVGVGDSQEARDVYLHDLQVEDAVYVNDKLVFEVKLSAAGYANLSAPVALYEKGQEKPLDSKVVTVDAQTKTVKVRLTHRPTEPGEKTYVLRVPVQEGEVDRDNNAIERAVWVRESKQIEVLYVEGYRRYEYHYLKTLLERESNRVKGNKSVNLKVLLLDADADFPAEDKSAVASFPTKEELKNYDVVILGDVDPEPRDGLRMTEHLKDLADFVREKGGGLLMLAGERHAPRSYRNTPLKDILPIDLVDGRGAGEGDEDGPLVESYRAELTPTGKAHPIFRFSPDDKESDDIWARLREFYWYADGYEPKRAAEVLAWHPRARAARAGKGEAPDAEAGAATGAGRHALAVQHFVGSGRVMFLGFNETWRWNWREDQAHYNQFWIQAVRYLSRSRLGRVELKLDRQTPYRRGEPIKMTVRFPDDAPPPADKTEVKVVVERRPVGKPGGEVEVRTVALSRLEGSRATYESLLTQTPEGDYKFWLSQPAATPRPRAECRVLAPPGELEKLRMAQAEMEQAAGETGGRFYTLATVERLADDLPQGTRVTVNAAGPPWLVWNQPWVFALVLGFLTMEWIFRKQKNLL